MKYFFGLITGSLLLLSACQKKDNTPQDPARVAIDIAAPDTVITYHKGDTVFVAAHISYITEMHGYNVRIADTTSGITYYETEDHVHGDDFRISEYWVNTADKALTLQLRVTVILDHDGSTAEQSVYFNTQP